MSAIGAIFFRNNAPVTAEQAACVASELQIFGRRRSDQWRDGPTYLVRQTLDDFTPEDAFDRQPLTAEDGKLVGIFDGYLDYRDDLVRALGIDPHDAAVSADSALVMSAWERWGEHALERLHGEFVLVVWNRPQRRLMAACAPLHSPPLYFSLNPQRVLLATAPRGIFALGDVERRIDEQQLANNLILNARDTRSTYYENIHCLCPGERLTVTPDQDHIHRYYSCAEHITPIRFSNPADYIEATQEVLEGAVSSKLRAPETPAILLSGGLDSPAVAVTALDLLQGRPDALPLLSVTAHPEKGWDGVVNGRHRIGDESDLVRKLVEMYPQIDARFTDAEGLGAGHLLYQMFELAEAPMRGAMMLPWMHACLQQVRDAGRRVVLSGSAGNLTLSANGTWRFLDLLRSGHLPTLFRELAAIPNQRFRILSPLFRKVLLPYLPDWVHGRMERRRGIPADKTGWHGYSPIHPGFAREMQVEKHARAHGLDTHFRGFKSGLTARLFQFTGSNMRGIGRSFALAHKVIHGVEHRDPLGEQKLVEWCLGLPDDQFMNRGETRLLIRRLMQGKLPPEILTAPRGRQVPDWHLRLGRDLPHFREMLHNWQDDPKLSRQLDIKRLLDVVDTWPTGTPTSYQDHPDFKMVYLGLARAITTAKFVRWVEGRNG